MIRILIADDHSLFREGLARVLNEAPGMSVVASVSNGLEALSRVAEFKPDVILMDVNMPKLGGVEATRQLRKIHPQASVLMLTISEDEHDLYAAIRAGARGYLLKSASAAELIDGIRRVYAKEAILTPGMAAKLLNEFASISPAPTSLDSDDDRDDVNAGVLTEREREVLQWVARGMTNKEIGAQLSLSPHTIKAHIRTILEKLHVRSRAEAAAWATRHENPK
ncbi:MAG TPA: response regulator transcription factor [Anaerolineales bacterium]|nr:response regulator transcription factor [Anaerolineales bacterium]